jgi:hypothetical protein
MSERLLGKLPATKIEGLPDLGRYTVAMVDAPATLDWCHWDDWGTMLNKRLKDCTVASCAHAVETWTAYGSQRFVASDGQVTDFYEKTCGYVPGRSDTDKGGYLSEVLHYWLTQSPLGGHKIDAFTRLDPSQFSDLQDSIWLFGGASLGVELPLSAKGQLKLWSSKGTARGDHTPGSWGGHAIWAYGYDTREQTISFVSWGRPMKMTVPFYLLYCSEAFGLYSRDWLDKVGLAPNGFKGSDLIADMDILLKR